MIDIRRRLKYLVCAVVRICGGWCLNQRIRLCVFVMALMCAFFTILVLASASYYVCKRSLRECAATLGVHSPPDYSPSQRIVHAHSAQNESMAKKITSLEEKLNNFEVRYRVRHREVVSLLVKPVTYNFPKETAPYPPGYSEEAMNMIHNLTGTRVLNGLQPRYIHRMQLPFLVQILTHLLNDPFSLWPLYHLSGARHYMDFVIGIPTVKRDKQTYLFTTLTYLIKALSAEDKRSVVIVILVGEPDVTYILKLARQIEIMFPREISDGVIEILAPSPAYYPELEDLCPTLGDSPKRAMWRTKQNLDNIYLMAYAIGKGVYYLMLEDDVTTKKDFLPEMKGYIETTTEKTPHWIFIEFCQVGAIGKVFRTRDLLPFVTYSQIFYSNMPIDWLLESYLADRVCSIDKKSKSCAESKLRVRPRYKVSLFQHIGVYSSLQGKIQKVQDPQFGKVQSYFPHQNPPVQKITTTIEDYYQHSIQNAYEGIDFFWGKKPKKGDTLEFWYGRPLQIKRVTFRSGNAEHITDQFYNTVVEVLPAFGDNNFTTILHFDEFGLADGDVEEEFSLVKAIRLRVNADSKYWVILSEIYIQTPDEKKT
ncbi:alpha-1,3-mannosyl-glycoprotein 4-beta-N-acetylglucosaminyltransferase A-like isoform X3 [Bombyx mandarina]|uniref:Alpha-1,3-mannosyl-glycoprotein 4-beta-N-acetylglucosaminyltransferase A-like isoform X3 n=1 Tax=Bombyx mandarina TaxID=7092 RepID=A0A6J2JY81_BOMMA|nr:alpha-1,3-mannosyl-glycoprotein 4-beta-N-acetylglucosaminyltransferase A-like isoform X3 [Bombyx mandarina]